MENRYIFEGRDGLLLKKNESDKKKESGDEI